MEIIPAILETEFSEIQNKIEKSKKHFKTIQIDLGDGKFVESEFGQLKKIKDIKSEIDLEIHLMTEEPWKDLEYLRNGKIKKITFHYESFLSIPKKTRPFAINNLIKQVKELGLKVGIAINPETRPGAIADYLERIDEALLLSVEPGQQGQKFVEDVILKASFLKNFKEDLIVGIDGGVSDENIKKIAEAKIDKVYVGSFLWKDDLESALKKLS